MKKLLHLNQKDVSRTHRNNHDGYEYFRRQLVSGETAQQCAIAVYEIPPGKSAYPYHYHAMNEEAFYIISGAGILKTPEGEREVNAGDFLFFPANENGAHKLTNASDTELLIYLDFDTRNDIDVAFYPDSGKIGVWGKDINQLYRTSEHVPYYDGE